MSDRVEITFLPQNKKVNAARGANLLDLARELFIDMESSCSGKGTCGKCFVRWVDGPAPSPVEDDLKHIGEDKLSEGVRLACRIEVDGEGVFEALISSGKKHKILSEGIIPEFELRPNISKRHVALPKPTLSDSIDDLGRIEREIKRKIAGDVTIQLLRGLPGVLRDGGYNVTLVHAGGKLAGLEPGDTTGRLYGVAVDIGTTTVVASLVNLNTGEELSTASMLNPQKGYGLDVLTRIQHIRENAGGLEKMSSIIREGVNGFIKEVCGETRVAPENIYEVAVAGNSTMIHLFLGVDPGSLGRSPYISVFSTAVDVPAKELGLEISDFGTVHCLPSVSSYIGADIVAGLIVTEMENKNETALFIDIGTNGEIAMFAGGVLSACSCAAGPALEGMNISCGMRAANGAIDKIFIDDTGVSVHTIRNKPAVGLCGSGVIDAVGELVKAGAVTKSGRFIKPSAVAGKNWLARLDDTNGGAKFILSEGGKNNEQISITQKDIRQVQLAKGAILSGILALTKRLEINIGDIERVYIAGAFGHHVRLESLARLGILPEELHSKVALVGNSSKTGAMLCLLSLDKREEANDIARRVIYIELSCVPGYDRLFTECLSFPDTSLV